jgi:DNA anti-recombination protein RmuC
VDDSAAPPRPAGTGPDDVDRLEALEHQVRQLMSRLAGWVEAQLVQALDDRRNDLKALRAELQLVLDEQLAGVRAETASVLSVATHRIDVGQEQLTERLEVVAGRAAEAAAARAAASVGPVDGERLQRLEQQVGSRLDGVAARVEAELAEAAERRRAEL